MYNFREMKFNNDNLNIGHRQRLREKFISSKDSLDDYELLEMLLFLSNSRKDTKGIAKELINNFGSLNNVLDARVEDLQKVPNIGLSNAIALKTVREVINRVLKNDIKQKGVQLNNSTKVEEYCKLSIGNSKNEVIKALFLNGKLDLVKDEIIGNGNINEVKLYKNVLIAKATQYGCCNIILVHNHPTNDVNPSVADIQLTIDLKELLSMVDMNLVDHIIVSKDYSLSMAKEGLMNKQKALKYINKKLFN